MVINRAVGIRPGQHSVDAVRVADLRDVVAVPLLNHRVAAVNVSRLVRHRPTGPLPGVFPRNPPSAHAIVEEIFPPLAGQGHVRELVFLVVAEGFETVVGQVAVGIVLQGDAGGQVGGKCIGCRHGTVIILSYIGDVVRSIVQRQAVAAGEGEIGVGDGGLAIHGHAAGRDGGIATHGQGARAADTDERVGIVQREVLHQRIIGALFEVAGRVVAVTQLFIQTRGAVGFRAIPPDQLTTDIVTRGHRAEVS